MDYIEFPVFNATTPQGQIAEIKDYLLLFMKKYNMLVSECRSLQDKVKELQDG